MIPEWNPEDLPFLILQDVVRTISICCVTFYFEVIFLGRWHQRLRLDIVIHLNYFLFSNDDDGDDDDDNLDVINCS